MKRSHRQVAVILNADVADVGFAGELQTVKAGFARNFLLAKNVAELATPGRIKQREAEMAKAAERRAAEVASKEEVSAKLSSQPIKLTLNTGPGGQVFGSISAPDVAAAIKKQHDLTLDPKQLLGLPLKALGAATVSAKLGVGVVAEVPIEVKGKLVRKKDDELTDSERDAEEPEEATDSADADSPTEALAPTT